MQRHSPSMPTARSATRPAANFNGSDSFTYKVSDGELESNTATVTITVNAVNDPLTIAVGGGGQCLSDTRGRVNLLVGDVETPASSLTLTATSSNTQLVPVSNITLGGTGANRTATITTVSGRDGQRDHHAYRQRRTNQCGDDRHGEGGRQRQRHAHRHSRRGHPVRAERQ